MKVLSTPPQTAKPSRILVVSTWVLFYGLTCTLLATVVGAALMGWLAWTATRELAGAQRALHEARGANRVCRRALERCDTKLEVVDEWILGPARKMRER